MQIEFANRYRIKKLALIGIALYAVGGLTPIHAQQASFVQDGKAGFVVSYIEYALSPADTKLISISSNGQAAVLGQSCNGAYYALHEFADGNRVPNTGKCTSISTQYHIKAIPAFVVDAATKGLNEDLKGK